MPKSIRQSAEIRYRFYVTENENPDKHKAHDSSILLNGFCKKKTKRIL